MPKDVSAAKHPKTTTELSGTCFTEDEVSEACTIRTMFSVLSKLENASFDILRVL